MSDTPRQRGTEAENRVAEFLLSRGYTLLRRRYQANGGEIDLVALDGEILVFIEVKQRATLELALESVHEGKLRRIVAAAEAFRYEFEATERETRFDLAAVLPNRIDYIEGWLE